MRSVHATSGRPGALLDHVVVHFKSGLMVLAYGATRGEVVVSSEVSIVQYLWDHSDGLLIFFAGFSIPCTFIVVALWIRVRRLKHDLAFLQKVWAESREARDELRGQRTHALAVNLGMSDRTAGELDQRWKDLDQCFLNDFLALLKQGEITAFHAFAMQYAQNMAIHDLAILNVFLHEKRSVAEHVADD